MNAEGVAPFCRLNSAGPQETMSEPDSSKATRLVASHFAKYSTDLIGYAKRRYDISIEDMAILAVVFSESTRPLREDPYLAAKFGFEDRALPDEYRLSVSLKFVHASLGLSRETTRRKVERLVARGFLTRISSGYVFPGPQGRPELSKSFRSTLVKSIAAIAAQAERIRSPE